MKVYHNFSEYSGTNVSVTTIGMFDGVHIGHQKVILHCVEVARKNSQQVIVISFSNHPSSYFTTLDTSENNLITTVDEKIELFQNLGVDILFIIPFDKYIATIPAKGFVEDILLNCLKTKSFVLGYDNRFGFKREGSVNFVNKNYSNAIQTFEIAAETLDNEIISSTRIKNYLREGQIEKVNNMLGRLYSLKGTVILGNQIGRQLNFPTANLLINSTNKFLPAFGVYLTEIMFDGIKLFGLTNIGIRPTLELKESKTHIETFIFNFDREIYGQKLEIRFLKKCRNEMKFSSLDDLKFQIAQDVTWAENELAKIHIAS